MAPHARRRAVAAALLLRHAATFTYSRPMRRGTQLRDTYLIDNEDVGGPLEPLSDYLLVKVDETAEKTSGGIMISDKAKEPPPTGVVQTVGPGALHPESGTVLPIDCKEGDNVMWGRYAGANVKYQRESHTLLKDRDVNICVEINQRCLLEAMLAPSSGEEPTPPRHRAGVTSMAWRTTRRFNTNAP